MCCITLGKGNIRSSSGANFQPPPPPNPQPQPRSSENIHDGSIEMEAPYQQQQHHQQTDEESGVTNPALVVEDWWDFLKKCVKINWFDYFKIIITYYVSIIFILMYVYVVL